MRILLTLALLCGGLQAQGVRSLLLGLADAPNTPTDSPGGGSYGSTQSVTLSDATATFINYTTNGSTPACPATGTLYTGAISVAATTTIKAIGCNGVTGGGVLSSTYTISAGGTFTKICEVHAVPGTGGGATGACDMSTATLLLIIITDGNAGATYACSDSSSNTYSVAAKPATQTDAFVQLCYVRSPTVTNSMTGSGTSGGNQPNVTFVGFTGNLTSSSPYDDTNSSCANNNSGNTGAPGSVTPGETNDLTVTALSNRFGTTSTLSSYTFMAHYDAGGANYAGSSAYNIQTTATATNPNWAWTTSGQWASCVWTFKHS